MTEELSALWKRQASKFEPPDAAADDGKVPEAISDEQLVWLRTRIDEAFGAGTGDAFLQSVSRPMPDTIRDAIGDLPEGFPATSLDFVESHETLRRVIGDLRKPRDETRPEPASDEAHQPDRRKSDRI